MNTKRLVILLGTTLLGLTLAMLWIGSVIRLTVAHASGSLNEINQSVASLDTPDHVIILDMVTSSTSATIFVDASNNTGIEDGTQAYPFNTIQEGLGVAFSGETVQVAAGIYNERITMKNGVQLLGAGAASTIIDGTGQNDSVVSVSNVGPGTIIDGFSITHGTGKQMGIYTYGGALYGTNSSLVLLNCIITENNASDGAGGVHIVSSTLIIDKCIFDKNNGWYGGAINIVGGKALIQNSIIDGSSSGYGGALYVSSGAQVTSVNNLIMHTSIPAPAIGIQGDSSAVIINNTIVDNEGSGIETNSYIVGGGSEGSATIKNSILWGNNDDLVNLTATYSDIEDADPGDGNISTYPLFVEPEDSDYHLRRFSQCIDVGTNDGAPLADFEGDPRPLDGDGNGVEVVDIGADEFDPLIVNKWATSNATPGDQLNYIISLQNNSGVSITNVVLTDTLPLLVTYLNDSLTATRGDYGYSTGVITWTGALDPVSGVTITYGTVVTENIAGGTPLINSVVISQGGRLITQSTTIYVDYNYAYLPIATCKYCPDFFDDFSNPASGWYVGEDEFVRSEYLDSEFRILTKNEEYIYLYTAPTCGRENYVVEVDARWVGTPGASYGLLFGIAGSFDQYYFFEVNSDNQVYWLGRYAAYNYYPIAPISSSSAIKSGTAPNHLKVTRDGDQITLEVNGIVLGTWRDGNITGLTYMGIVSSPYLDESASDSRFDNFSVITLPPSGTSGHSWSGSTKPLTTSSGRIKNYITATAWEYK